MKRLAIIREDEEEGCFFIEFWSVSTSVEGRLLRRKLESRVKVDSVVED